MNEMPQDLQMLADLVVNMEIDDSAIAGQDIDQEMVNWYTTRFDMFQQDGCLEAMNAYLARVNRDETVNEFTRLVIMQNALSRLCK